MLSQDLANFWHNLEADVDKAVRLELRRIEKGQEHKTAEQLTAYLDGIMRAAANQVSGQCERDPFGRKSAGKRARGAATTVKRRPGMAGGPPPTFMRKKIQLDKVPGAARGAPTKKNV